MAHLFKSSSSKETSTGRQPLLSLRNAVKRSISSISSNKDDAAKSSSKAARMSTSTTVVPPCEPVSLPLLGKLMHEAHGWSQAAWEQQHALTYMLTRQQRLPVRALHATGAAEGPTDVMRCTLVDWLANVSYHIQLMPETWSRAVQLTDMYAARVVVAKDDYQLLGISALWVAAKLEERYVPTLATLVDLGDESFTEIEVATMERALLLELDFDINRPEPIYLIRFLIDWIANFHASQTSPTVKQMLYASFYACALYVQQPFIYRRDTASQVAVAAVITMTRVYAVPMPPGLHDIMWDNSTTLRQPINTMATLLLKNNTSTCYSLAIKAWFARTRFERIAIEIDTNIRARRGVLQLMAIDCDAEHRPLRDAPQSIRASEGVANTNYSSSDCDYTDYEGDARAKKRKAADDDEGRAPTPSDDSFAS